MMKLDEIRKAYEDLSGSLSSVVRQINFAGIAIVWIFVGKETETVSVPQHLYNACTFLVISIILDVLQYLVGTFSWHMCYLFKHKKNVADKDTDIHESEWVNVIPWLCIYAKTIVTAIGYGYILSFLMKHFSL